ncbi:MAG: hypothetical protein Q8O28_11825 [Smithellaceae bacterium]|nr:hypothetical protein [Smithellaceae bacterium]
MIYNFLDRKSVFKSIMHINIIMSVSTLLLLSTFAVADTNEKTHETRSWQARCEELKKNQDTNLSLKVTFSEKPKINSAINHWLFSWNGINIPLPPVDFHEVYLKSGYQNYDEVMMIAKDGFIINALVFENKPSGDVLAESQAGKDSNDGWTEITAAAAIKEGSPVRASDSILLGYHITPGDLSCLARNRTEETAKVAALIMKGIGRPGELIAVYKDVGVYRGWIEVEKSTKHMTYIINIILESNIDVWYQINYRMPNNFRYHGLSFLIGNNRQKHISPSPDWLLALNSAIISKSKDSWKRYATLARKAGISEKSITRIMKNQNIEIDGRVY